MDGKVGGGLWGVLVGVEGVGLLSRFRYRPVNPEDLRLIPESHLREKTCLQVDL